MVCASSVTNPAFVVVSLMIDVGCGGGGDGDGIDDIKDDDGFSF